MEQAFLVGYARTPFDSFLGRWKDTDACELAALAMREAMSRASLPADAAVDEVILGCALPAGLGQDPASRAARLAGLPADVPAWSVSKVCASGMKAAALAAASVRSGGAHIVVAVGTENMSRVPRALPAETRWGAKLGDLVVKDLLQADGLVDAETGLAMGACAERCAAHHGITREAADAYAARSFERAIAAQAEIAAELVPALAGPDDNVLRFNPAKMASLPTPFAQANGTVTAANATPLSDGAAALVIASGFAVRRYGLRPVARIAGWADASQAGVDFATSPALAIPRALVAADLELADVDVFEINEAFAAVPIANAAILGADLAKVNVRGGAVALGHPLGASGARIVGSLAHILAGHPTWRVGVAAVCNGGGGASALVLVKDI